MSKYLALLKILLANTYRVNKNSTAKQKWLIAIIAVCILPSLALMCMAIHTYGQIALAMGIEREFLATLITMGSVTVFFFAIPSVLGYMFFSKDAELLSMLPVPKSTLFLAKFTMVYLSELLVAGITMIPVLIVYGIAVGAGAMYYVLILPVVLLIPVFPLVVVSILAFPLMWIVTFVKKTPVLTTILYVAGFGLLFGIILLLENSMIGSGEGDFAISIGFASFMSSLYEILIFNKFFAIAMLGSGIDILLYMLLGIAIEAVLLGISVCISSAFFHKGVSYQTEGMDSGTSGSTKVVANDKTVSIILKDLRQLIRDPGFAFQSLAGLVIAPLLIGIMSGGLRDSLVYSQIELLKEGLQITDVGIELFMTALLLFYSVLLVSGMNYTASGAYTREGKTFYINKYIPASASLILRSKLMLADIVTILTVVLTITVCIVTGALSPLNSILMGAVLILMGLALNGMGIRRDLKRPKLEWNNVNEAFKNNFYMALPMFISMIIGVALLVVAIVLIGVGLDDLWIQVCYWLLTFAVSAVLFGIFRTNVTKDATKMMEMIE